MFDFFPLKLCGRCLSNKEQPAMTRPELIEAFADEELKKRAKDAGAAYGCPRCCEPLANEEVLGRDEIIQIILMSLDEEKLTDATARMMEATQETTAKLKAEAAKRAQKRAEKRAKEEAEGVEYERVGIFWVPKKKEDQNENS